MSSFLKKFENAKHYAKKKQEDKQNKLCGADIALNKLDYYLKNMDKLEKDIIKQASKGENQLKLAVNYNVFNGANVRGTPFWINKVYEEYIYAFRDHLDINDLVITTEIVNSLFFTRLEKIVLQWSS